MKETSFNEVTSETDLSTLVRETDEFKKTASDTASVGCESVETYNGVSCDECHGNVTIQNDELVCSGCGIIKTLDNYLGSDERVVTYRIKIIGKDGGQFQHDLDKSAPINAVNIRKQSVLKELMTLNLKYIDKGGKGIPGDALKIAADSFNQMQDHYIKRGMNKRQILCSLIYIACMSCGYHRDKTDIAAFSELPSGAMSKGDVIVRTAVAEGKLDMKINEDTSEVHIETLFEKINSIIAKDDAIKYRKAIVEMIKVCENVGICSSNQMKSKVAGFLIFLLQMLKKDKTAEEVLLKIDVRPNTIKKIVAELDDFESYFSDIVKKIDN